MKECPVCNTQNEDHANVCMECGTRFENNIANSDIPQQHLTNQDEYRPVIKENIGNTGIEEVQYAPPANNANQYQPQNTQQFNNSNQYQQQNYQQFNNANQYQPQNYQYNNQNQFQQNNMPLNQKSKAVGIILNILLVGLGYAYVGKWGEGIVLAVIYLILIMLSFLVFPLFIAIVLWIYSLIKTNDMIDKYNKGLPY